MVEVTLREYSEEIDNLIDQGAFDAAISHCQHILKIHPKYLKAYSLLGKAALEKGDLEAAADLFGRVLSMDPEDFVARVGMSITSDKDGSLDQAIWHMERAFELAPDNQAIVGELGRLYGRRDGAEPKKVQLTQGALARLHARGNLYTQAINEQRRLLQTEPDRVDLQVALAETLWQADRRIEAAEASLALLESLPYCLKANLILGEIWSSSGREMEGAAHLERAQMIDPENEVAQHLFGVRSPLPRSEVRVGRMEYVSPPAPAEQEPEWLQNLIDEDGGAATPDDAVPDWLQAVAASAAIESMAPDEDSAPEAEEVPDWLQDVAATADVDAEEFVAAPETPAPSEDDMPEWLAQLTTEPQDESDQAITAEPADMPDWLAEVGPATAGLVAAELAAAGLTSATEDEPEPTETELFGVDEGELTPGEIPDWLAEMAPADAEAFTDVGLDEVGLAEESDVEPGEIPDWLADMAPTELDAPADDSLRAEAMRIGAEPALSDISDIPEWLAEAEPTTSEEPTAEPGELPDWLAGMEPEAVEAEDSELTPGEIPDWLAEMAPADAGVPTAELPVVVETEPSEVPDWLDELGALAEETTGLEETAPIDVDVPSPPELAELEPTKAVDSELELVAEELEPAPPLAAAETPNWLEELVIAAGVTMEEEEALTEQTGEPDEGEVPEWLAEMDEAPGAEIPEAETATVLAEDLDSLEGELLTSDEAVEGVTLDAETELMARMEEMSPDEAFAAWETMLAESDEEQIEETAPEPEEAASALDAEAELMALMEDLPPEDAFAAWEAALAEDEDVEAAAEPDALPIEPQAAAGPVVIEEPDKETLVYPEGAGGEITDAEAELMAQMEEMSPEEAFAAWEAMLADGEEPKPEVAARSPKDVVAPIDEIEEQVSDAETELMARLEEMSPEEAFAAWETMLAEGEATMVDEATTVAEDVVLPSEEREETQDSDAELLARLEEMSPEEAFAAWETMLAEGETLVQEEVANEPEGIVIPHEVEEETHDADTELLTHVEEISPAQPSATWESVMADSDKQLPEEEPLPTEVQVDPEAAEIAQELPELAAAGLDEAWMTLAEDEGPEEMPELPVSEEELFVAESVAVEIAEEEAPEIDLPPWATAEAVETIDEVPLPAEQEIQMGPDLVLLTEEEEVEITLPQEPKAEVVQEPAVEVPEEPAAELVQEPDAEVPREPEAEVVQEPERVAPIEVSETVPAELTPTAEEAALVAEPEAVIPSDLEEEVETDEQPAWVAMEEVSIAEALVEEVPEVEEKAIEPDSDQARLELAREMWTSGQQAQARTEYERLLRSNMRDEVTADLEKLAADESVDEPTLRLLGDAYMKQDRLPEALEAYRRALSRL